MTTVTIVPGEAGEGQRIARRLEGSAAVPLQIHDAAVVDWPVTDARPVAWQVTSLHHRLALTGAFWGLLFAHVFLLPLSLGEDVADRPADRSLRGLGFDDRLLAMIRTAVGPGSSAVFVVHADATADRLTAALSPFAAVLPPIRLTAEESRRLYAGFADQPV